MNKTATIYVNVDRSCDMAHVQTKLTPVPEGLEDYHFEEMGNFWDFHPGCCGNHTFSDYRGYSDLAAKMKRYLQDRGYDVTIQHNTNWRYED